MWSQEQSTQNTLERTEEKIYIGPPTGGAKDWNLLSEKFNVELTNCPILTSEAQFQYNISFNQSVVHLTTVRQLITDGFIQ